MSHFTTIETQIRDVAALEAACREMGLTLLKNTNARGYYEDKPLHGDYVIRLKGPYDVALTKQPSGLYSLATDWHGGYVQNEVGEGYCKLIQLYGVHKTLIEARKKGLTSRRQVQSDGSIRISIGGM